MPYAGGHSFADPARRRLYLFGDWLGIDVYDTDTLARLGNIPQSPAAYDLSSDGTRLYIAPYFEFSSDDPAIYLYDTASLALSRTIPYPCDDIPYCGIYALAEGPDDRLYVARADYRTFDVIDAHTGARLHTETLASPPYIPSPTLAAYGDTLYVGSSYDQTADAAGVTVFNIAGVVPVRVAFQPTETGPGRIALSAAGDYVTVGASDDVYQFRADPFAPLWHLNGYLSGVYPNGDVLAVAIESPGHDMVAVNAHDAATGAPQRAAAVQNQPHIPSHEVFLPLSDGGLALYAPPTGRLELRRPVDYAAAVPVVSSNACPSGPFRDTFDDPASGWPTRADERVVYEVAGGVYRVLLRPAGVWTGLSRGDRWGTSRIMSITAQPAVHTRGTFGLIFNLNDDWTEFYTFEMYPRGDQWFITHFHDGDWELVQLVDRNFADPYLSLIHI